MGELAFEGPALATAGLEWTVAGRPIVCGVELTVASGECIAIVGPNGAGKTSLLRLLGGLIEPSGGEVFLAGDNIRSLPRREIARRLAYVPQMRPNRIPLKVEQMVLLGRYPHWSGRQMAPVAADFEAVHRALARVGLENLRQRRVDRLSGGEQQGVFLAACLAQEARILLLDEPTTHLDPRHQREVATLIRDLSREAERTIVCATHDLNFASLIADRILGLRGGRVAAAGPPAEMITPENLERLFEAEFAVVSRGKRPMTMLDLEER